MSKFKYLRFELKFLSEEKTKNPAASEMADGTLKIIGGCQTLPNASLRFCNKLQEIFDFDRENKVASDGKQ